MYGPELSPCPSAYHGLTKIYPGLSFSGIVNPKVKTGGVRSGLCDDKGQHAQFGMIVNPDVRRTDLNAVMLSATTPSMQARNIRTKNTRRETIKGADIKEEPQTLKFMASFTYL